MQGICACSLEPSLLDNAIILEISYAGSITNDFNPSLTINIQIGHNTVLITPYIVSKILFTSLPRSKRMLIMLIRASRENILSVSYHLRLEPELLFLHNELKHASTALDIGYCVYCLI